MSDNPYQGSIYDEDVRHISRNGKAVKPPVKKKAVSSKTRVTKKTSTTKSLSPPPMIDMTDKQINKRGKILYDVTKWRMDRKIKKDKKNNLPLKVKERNLDYPRFCPVFPKIRLNYNAISLDRTQHYRPTADDHPDIARLSPLRTWRGQNVRVMSKKAADLMRGTPEELRAAIAFIEAAEEERKRLREEKRLAKRTKTASKTKTAKTKPSPTRAAASTIAKVTMPKPVIAEVMEPDELVRIAGKLYSRFGDKLLLVPEA